MKYVDGFDRIELRIAMQALVDHDPWLDEPWTDDEWALLDDRK